MCTKFCRYLCDQGKLDFYQNCNFGKFSKKLQIDFFEQAKDIFTQEGNNIGKNKHKIARFRPDEHYTFPNAWGAYNVLCFN